MNEKDTLRISDILIEEFDLESFDDLVQAVKKRARSERFLRIDVKPPFADTPENWEDPLESAFVSPLAAAEPLPFENTAGEKPSAKDKGKN